MTRFEQGEKKLARDICDAISEKIECCERCPFSDRCRQGHNGILDYLMEEVEE